MRDDVGGHELHEELRAHYKILWHLLRNIKSRWVQNSNKGCSKSRQDTQRPWRCCFVYTLMVASALEHNQDKLVVRSPLRIVDDELNLACLRIDRWRLLSTNQAAEINLQSNLTLIRFNKQQLCIVDIA